MSSCQLCIRAKAMALKVSDHRLQGVICIGQELYLYVQAKPRKHYQDQVSKKTLGPIFPQDVVHLH